MSSLRKTRFENSAVFSYKEGHVLYSRLNSVQCYRSTPSIFIAKFLPPAPALRDYSQKGGVGFLQRQILAGAQELGGQFQRVQTQSHFGSPDVEATGDRNNKSISSNFPQGMRCFVKAYFPFVGGLGQTQWNFPPKSMYKSSWTMWKMVPSTIFPSGSPN